MSNARKKAKKEKHAKARQEKAKLARARHVETKKAERDHATRAPTHEKRLLTNAGKPAASKPSGRPSSQGHRTQGR